MTTIDPSLPRTGCLTEDEVAEIRAAAPGDVPERLAHHLTRCPSCQERVLFGTQTRKRRRRGASAIPTPMRAFVLLAIMILVMTAFFYTLSQLIGEPYK